MNKYLNTLALDVLMQEKNGIGKVRFAKVLYFVHKGLVQEGMVSKDDLKFIRMPLGPVPVGFMELDKSSDINITISEHLTLTYNMQIYKLKNMHQKMSDYGSIVEKIVKSLRFLQTSELVEISHHEPSWQMHKNGEEYCLTDEDLKKTLPIPKKIKMSPKTEEQRLQARLVEGMIDEIVEESTSLEYPKT